MSCPTCSHSMHGLAVGAYWCPRCGTLVGGCADGSAAVPKLVERCRAFEGSLRRCPDATHTVAEVFHGFQLAWRALGIAEAVNPPEGRPA